MAPFQFADGTLVFANLPFLALRNVAPEELSADDVRFTDVGLRSEIETTAVRTVLTDGDDTFVVSRVDGSEVEALAGNDTVVGAFGDDTLLGGAGDDDLSGQGGADLLDGGSGLNLLSGGDGSDVFRLRDVAGVSTRDVITDFVLGVDRILLDTLPGIQSLDDVAMQDTAEGLEFSLGEGRTLVIAGLTTAEEFSSSDIEVIPGPELPPAASAAAPAATAPVAAAATPSDAESDTFTMRAYTVSVGAYDAAGLQGVNFDFSLVGPVPITVPGVGRMISPDDFTDTRIFVGDDDQGAVTRIFYDQITVTTPDNNVVTHDVAVLERAVTADYLIVPIDVETGFAAAQYIPTGAAFKRVFNPDAFEGEISLMTEVEAAGSVRLTDANDNFITADPGANAIDGLQGDDVILTGAGNDLLLGNVGSDLLIAGAGDDILIGGPGADIQIGNQGSDIFAFDVADFQLGGVQIDIISDFEVGVDTVQLAGLNVESIQDTPNGALISLGDSRFINLKDVASADVLAGDIEEIGSAYSFAAALSDAEVNLTGENDRLITNATTPLTVNGLGGSDVIIGGVQNDVINGGADSDLLLGDLGDDMIRGGAGSDQQSGGGGADQFFFTLGEETGFTSDTITDFEIGTDLVMLEGYGFGDVDELTFTDLGDKVALQLENDRFVIFEGIEDPDQLRALNVFDFG